MTTPHTYGFYDIKMVEFKRIGSKAKRINCHTFKWRAKNTCGIWFVCVIVDNENKVRRNCDKVFKRCNIWYQNILCAGGLIKDSLGLIVAVDKYFLKSL